MKQRDRTQLLLKLRNSFPGGVASFVSPLPRLLYVWQSSIPDSRECPPPPPPPPLPLNADEDTLPHLPPYGPEWRACSASLSYAMLATGPICSGRFAAAEQPSASQQPSASPASSPPRASGAPRAARRPDGPVWFYRVRRPAGPTTRYPLHQPAAWRPAGPTCAPYAPGTPRLPGPTARRPAGCTRLADPTARHVHLADGPPGAPGSPARRPATCTWPDGTPGAPGSQARRPAACSWSSSS